MTTVSTKKLSATPTRLIATSVLFSGLFFNSAAIANVTATFADADQNNITVEYRDDNHVRLSSSSGNDLIITGGEAYEATRLGGSWTVIPFKEMAELISAFGAGALELGGSSFSSLATGVATEVLKTGRQETVAGIPGDVYEIVIIDGTYRDVREVVASNNPAALDAYKGLLRIGDLMGEMVGIQSLTALMDERYGLGGQALLRVEDEWVLTRVVRGNIADSSFQLPAAPSSMAAMAGLMSGNMQQTSEGVSAALGQWLNDEAANAGDAASDEANSVIDEATSAIGETVQEARDNLTDSIRQGVRSGLRGLFQ